MELIKRLTSDGPKRILALDGGGVRGALTLGFLEAMEQTLRDRHRKPDLKLCDYFDLIGGTSIGAIIAAGLAIGMDVSEIKHEFMDLAESVFGKRKWKIWEAAFDVKPLEEQLARICGDRTLGDPSIRTGLCIVTKRADTGSTWPLINHPNAKYHQENSQILLRDALRASTAAPTYFVPAKIEISPGQIGAFLDGGVSMANNPALQLFLLATLKGFPFRWPTGEDRLLLVSVGTGTSRRQFDVDDVLDSEAWDWAARIPAMLMDDASWQAQLLLQYFSETETPWHYDDEVGDLKDDLLTPKPLLRYLRYNAWLEADALEELGLAALVPHLDSLRELSAAEHREDLFTIGQEAAKRQVLGRHFPPAFDLDFEPATV